MSAIITNPQPLVSVGLASEEAIQSDQRYFTGAAREDDLPGAHIYFAPGYSHLSAGCVAYLEEPASIQSEPRAWIGQLESRLRRWGARWSRVYVRPQHNTLESAFTWWNYECRREWILFAPAAEFAGWDDNFVMHPIRSNLDWSANLHFHQSVLQSAHAKGSDGYEYQAAQWVAFMRQKSEAGAMEPYQLWFQQQVIAEVSIMRNEHTLRLKNLTVSPAWRQRGIGRQVASWLRSQAMGQGKAGVVVFTVEGSFSARAYFNAGFDPCGEILEWSRDLSGKES
ncbi:MAG: hypothetical protein NW208_13330 [Bryobacter sp.]|nr:hypothetical protein [Bryobacter sp.]